jgi:hypothetical protein
MRHIDIDNMMCAMFGFGKFGLENFLARVLEMFNVNIHCYVHVSMSWPTHPIALLRFRYANPRISCRCRPRRSHPHMPAITRPLLTHPPTVRPPITSTVSRRTLSCSARSTVPMTVAHGRALVIAQPHHTTVGLVALAGQKDV